MILKVSWGTAFGRFLLGSHNFMVTALGSCEVALSNVTKPSTTYLPSLPFFLLPSLCICWVFSCPIYMAFITALLRSKIMNMCSKEKEKGMQEEIQKLKQKTLKYYYEIISISLCYYLELCNAITT
jgi:hypothetical protein